jgi:hypothetical protein
MYGRFRSFLLGGGNFFLAAKDEEAPASFLLNGQCPVMVAVGGGGGCSGAGRGRGSASYKGERMRLSKDINGGTELDAAVASDTALLMTAQKWKQPSSLS